jgi:hypothetical protein
MLTGANEPKLKEPCHTTSVTRMASKRTPEPNRKRLRMALFRIIGGTHADLGVDCSDSHPMPARECFFSYTGRQVKTA